MAAVSSDESDPRVSFLTVNFNQPEVTRELLESLQQLTYPKWECIVVDNGSEPSRLPRYVEHYPQVSYFQTGENLGFAGGNNFGLAHCSGDFIFFINNDTEVPPGLLEPLLHLAAGQKSIGAISPRILYYHSPDRLQYAGTSALNPLTLRNETRGHQCQDGPAFHVNEPTYFGHGAAMMVPRMVIERVGTMRALYFLYYEELDWMYRIRQAGFDIWYCGETYVWHKESISTGKNSPLKAYYLTRNRLLFARLNFKGLQRLANWLYFSLVALPKNFLSYWLRGDKALARAVWRGYRWHWSYLHFNIGIRT